MHSRGSERDSPSYDYLLSSFRYLNLLAETRCSFLEEDETSSRFSGFIPGRGSENEYPSPSSVAVIDGGDLTSTQTSSVDPRTRSSALAKPYRCLSPGLRHFFAIVVLLSLCGLSQIHSSAMGQTKRQMMIDTSIDTPDEKPRGFSSYPPQEKLYIHNTSSYRKCPSSATFPRTNHPKSQVYA